jgi:cell division protein FtsW
MSNKKSPDFIFFLITILLLSIGIIMVFSSSAYTAARDMGDPYYYVRRQLIWAFLGLLGMGIVSKINLDFVKRMSNSILIFSILLLFFVLLMDPSKGASRWIGIGSLSIQPSEIIKLAMVIFLAKSLSINSYKIYNFKNGLLPYLILLAFICVLILAQPDLGTAIALAGTSYLLLAVAGAKLSHLMVLALGGCGAVFAAILMEPYRLRRFTAFINPYADPIGAGFQTIQSLLALGSGGFFGVGLARGLQKCYYIPERHNDFIYAVLGEELGFLGAVFVLILFFLFIWRGFKIAVSTHDSFKSLLAAGVTIMITLQALINIGVVTGSMPVTGITLPFISYGGSSLVFTLAGVGLVLNVSRYSR